MSRAVERARDLLVRSGAWLSAEHGVYALRLGADRRGRVSLTLAEPEFRALIDRPGLRRRPQGGWVARPSGCEGPSAPPGRPGVIDGQRTLIDAEGRMIRHAANLGESPIAWLARRRDAAGRPWLTPAEAAAGERLRTEVEQARAGPSLTMRWDALPRAGAGSAARVEPGDRALSAARRVEEALTAVGPRLRPMLTRICVHGDSLKLAETGLGLRRRQGKTLLKQALQALADHYGIG
ncbi:DUF6456 domain-containing protein [Brevundimonas mediterranea]|jgi:hypothetical protein|uniref:DUF6456 domain-containing protein n=2 Tax=Brevundimonas TaxID=41275 RepID=A0A7Z8Y6A4_9CAUL|nr:DUF6456 domain-containing protein [Brevundimonas mediterranea]OGN45875.1 MAG: hypothetical protein A3E24_12670 [Caulobacterales bacterium RIFCSPHIGHO2_12_FULL_68_13]VDC51757.1 hypothetical protein BREV_BREV_02947 [Brevundimonas mediterranea]